MYKDVLILHAVDSTTMFLSQFKNSFEDKYVSIEANESSIDKALVLLQDINSCSLIIFLGHGHSTGLYSPGSSVFARKIIIDAERANVMFKDNDVLLLSCNSSQFIDKLSGYKNIIGFGNIISSREELLAEMDHTGETRTLEERDIDLFNSIYTESIVKSLLYIFEKGYDFLSLSKYIIYHINKKINEILKNKAISNRKDIAKLLFEFRDEMVCKTTSH